MWFASSASALASVKRRYTLGNLSQQHEITLFAWIMLYCIMFWCCGRVSKRSPYHNTLSLCLAMIQNALRLKKPNAREKAFRQMNFPSVCCDKIQKVYQRMPCFRISVSQTLLLGLGGKCGRKSVYSSFSSDFSQVIFLTMITINGKWEFKLEFP